MRIRIVFGIVALSIVGFAMAAASPPTVDQLLGKYFAIHQSLSSDSVNGVAAAVSEMAKISKRAASTQPEGKEQLAALADLAGKFKAADLKSARNGFGELSDRLIAYLKASKAKSNPPYQFYCSMVKKNWLQPDKATRNPYYGSSMLTCGELVSLEKPVSQPDNQPMEHEMEHHH